MLAGPASRAASERRWRALLSTPRASTTSSRTASAEAAGTIPRLGEETQIAFEQLLLFECVDERSKRTHCESFRTTGVIRICGLVCGLQHRMVFRVNIIHTENGFEQIGKICKIAVERADTDASASGHFGGRRPFSTDFDDDLLCRRNDCSPGLVGAILEWLYRCPAIFGACHARYLLTEAAIHDTYSCDNLKSSSESNFAQWSPSLALEPTVEQNPYRVGPIRRTGRLGSMAEAEPDSVKDE